jgi:hypothetical protein
MLYIFKSEGGDMMERQKSGKVIAIVALLFAVAGLSLGFAAYSTTLNITSDADVKLGADSWDIGFSTVNSALTPGTVTGTLTGGLTGDAAGTLNLTQFVISQGTNATLRTTNGSKVEYNFYIVNNGKLDAYLNSVTMGNLSCTYLTGENRIEDDGHTVVSNGTGTISDTDCRAMFTATLDIGAGTTTKTTGQSQTSGFANANKLAKPSGSPTYVPVKLTIAYNNNSIDSVTTVPNGDFIVTLEDTTVVYGTDAN